MLGAQQNILLGDIIEDSVQASFLYISHSLGLRGENLDKDELQEVGILDLSLLGSPLCYFIGKNFPDHEEEAIVLVSKHISRSQTKNGGFLLRERGIFPQRADLVTTSFCLLTLCELYEKGVDKGLAGVISKGADCLKTFISGKTIRLSAVTIDLVLAAYTLAQVSLRLGDEQLRKEVARYLKPVLYSDSIVHLLNGSSSLPLKMNLPLLVRLFIDIGKMSNESSFINQAISLSEIKFKELLTITDSLYVSEGFFRKSKELFVPEIALWCLNFFKLHQLSSSPQLLDIGSSLLRFLCEIQTRSLSEYGCGIPELVRVSGEASFGETNPYCLRFLLDALLEAQMVFEASASKIDHDSQAKLNEEWKKSILS
jgi:hypothetical protein